MEALARCRFLFRPQQHLTTTMPIPSHLKHLYHSEEWTAVRALVLKRSNNTCEHCGKENGDWYLNVWTGRTVIVQIGVAHIDHQDLERFFDPENLTALCRACHLRFDLLHHKHTRSMRKDRARPLLNLDFERDLKWCYETQSWAAEEFSSGNKLGLLGMSDAMPEEVFLLQEHGVFME